MKLDLNQTLGLKGEYTIRKRCALTNRVLQEVGPFHNLITDIGLNRIGTTAPTLSHCYVGTGTVPPAVTDTTMSTFKVSSNSAGAVAQTAGSAPTWTCSMSRTYTFNAGTINGNITEVGVGWNASPVGALWSRELIVDSGGNPIAITILATEILEVVYALRLVIPQNIGTGTFTMGPNTFNYQIKAANAGSWRIDPTSFMNPPFMYTTYAADAAMSATIAGNISGTVVTGAPTQTPIVYVNNSLERVGFTSWALAQGNHATGVKGFNVGFDAGGSGFATTFYQMLLDAPIPKTNLNTMIIRNRYTWNRVP